MTRGPKTAGPEDPGQVLPMLTRTLLGSSLMIVVVGAVLRAQLTPQWPEEVGWGAAAVALLAPTLATLVRGEGLVAGSPREDAETSRARFGRRLAFFAINEGACVLCGVAMMFAPSLLPGVAALLPLAAMAINLPARTR